MSTTNPTKPPNVAPSTDANPPKSTAAATAQPPNTPSKKARTKEDELTAVKAGYRPCGTCLKEKFKIWQAREKDRHTLADHQDYLSLPFPIDPVDL